MGRREEDCEHHQSQAQPAAPRGLFHVLEHRGQGWGLAHCSNLPNVWSAMLQHPWSCSVANVRFLCLFSEVGTTPNRIRITNLEHNAHALHYAQQGSDCCLPLYEMDVTVNCVSYISGSISLFPSDRALIPAFLMILYGASPNATPIPST